MKKYIISAINIADQIFCPVFLKFFKEKNSLIVFLFHTLFRNEEEISLNIIDPMQRITIQHFSHFVEYYLNHDYIFISPNDILNGLNTDKKYALITFDDGYFNNQRALPILKEYGIPALFFISTNYVKYNKCFWWDVLYRERIKQGRSVEEICWEQQQLKESMTSEEIGKYIKGRFGEKTFEPIGDIDRPFTLPELKKFSKEKYVFLGNHTSDHAALTNYSSNGIKSQILDAQNTLYDITGTKPIAISYPYGKISVSNEVIRISKEIGLRLIFTGFKKNYLPLNFQSDGTMRLFRVPLQGNNELIKQCEVFRSDVSLYYITCNLLNLLKRVY
jgi:peptidoglycan/xylan/chitin deacetylase (PgdA/CDA1 family)